MDVYQIVTERIMKELENGIVPWHKPWITVHGGAFNIKSGNTYSLLNRMLLSQSGPYGTAKQWQSLGGVIRPNAQREIVTFWKMPERSENEGAADKKEPVRPILRYYPVYHISEVDGVDLPSEYQPQDSFDVCTDAECVFRHYVDSEKIKFTQGVSDEAYYSPREDRIHIPAMAQFSDAAEYYGTLFHEAIHSTSHPDRENRPGFWTDSFGKDTYSKEELVAEIGSSVLLASLGINTDDATRNSAAYIYEWLQQLKNDKRLITSAAGLADRAVKFILERHSSIQCASILQ